MTPIKIAKEEVICAKIGEVIYCPIHAATGTRKRAIAIETRTHKHKFKEIWVNPRQIPKSVESAIIVNAILLAILSIFSVVININDYILINVKRALRS